MIDERTNYVEGRRIDDVWRDAMWLCIKNGWDFVVKGGSYKGQIRKQLSRAQLVITDPGERPLTPFMPPNLDPTTSEEEIEKYFLTYLMNDVPEPGEQYTYGTFIKPQLPKIIDILIKAEGNTNQACISVGDKESPFLDDPPCLRMVDFKVVERKLEMTVFFRSWDLYAALPQNLGGLQMLKEYVLVNLQNHFDVEDGPLIAYSSGLHIYEQYFKIVDMLNVDKIKIGVQAIKDKEKFLSEKGI